jgi:uncharacterized protein (TIGR02466 family)
MVIDEAFQILLLSNVLSDCNFNDITKTIKNYQKKNQGVKVSNLGGWQSQATTKLVDKNLKNVFNQINKGVDLLVKKLNIKNNLHLKNYWFNVNNFGSSNSVHHHLHVKSLNIISGVFYVNCPENSGQIVFLNPNKMISTMFDDSVVNKYDNFNSSQWNFNPQKGLFILFPSYLEHYVQPSFSNEDRISIAFNYGLNQ